MEPNSFKEKVVFSIIDKLILGILAALVITFFQSQSEKSQKLADQSVLVSKIHTDILIEQRKKLSCSMGHYFLLIEEIKPNGKADSDKHSDKLSKLLQEIRAIIYNMGAVDEGIEKNAAILIESISNMNLLLMGQKSSGKKISDKANKVREEYSNVLENIRQVSRDVYKSEFNAAQN